MVENVMMGRSRAGCEQYDIPGEDTIKEDEDEIGWLRM